MADDFFQSHPEVRGSSHLGLHAMCTSVPAVRDWIANSLAQVVRNVPDLGGLFCITMSENHTNCFSQAESGKRKRQTPVTARAAR
jgi:hypothetical protein